MFVEFSLEVRWVFVWLSLDVRWIILGLSLSFDVHVLLVGCSLVFRLFPWTLLGFSSDSLWVLV